MSDFDFDFQDNMIGYAAHSQRARLAAAQAAAQAESLNLQKKIGQDLTSIGSQQLSIGRQHLEAEASEHERKRERTEQIRQFRNLLVDASGELADFRKQHLA